MSRVGELDRYSVIDLITLGRLSGRPHTIEIWFAQRDTTIYVLSGGGTRSDWVRNLIRAPEVRPAWRGTRSTTSTPPVTSVT